MNEKTRVFVVSCNVLQKELEQLVKQGDIDGKLVFVDKYFHIDYKLLEDNLRKAIKNTLPKSDSKIILVYGDLCLGPNGEMKKLVEEYKMIKVDAINCTDCLLGGKGKINEVDPKHELMVLHPGMIDFFFDLKNRLKQENIDEKTFKNLFSQLKGIILLDTLNDASKEKAKIEKLQIGLEILEIKKIGLDELKELILEAIRKHRDYNLDKK